MTDFNRLAKAADGYSGTRRDEAKQQFEANAGRVIKRVGQLVEDVEKTLDDETLDDETAMSKLADATSILQQMLSATASRDADENEVAAQQASTAPTKRRYHVADSTLGLVLAVVAGLVTTALMWDWATSHWLLEMPTILWGVLHAVISALIVYAVARLVGAVGDIVDSRRTQWVERGHSHG